MKDGFFWLPSWKVWFVGDGGGGAGKNMFFPHANATLR